MKGIRIGLLSLALLGCGAEDDTQAAAQPPPAVAPVEVTTEGEATADDPAALRARIAELEAELATCRGTAATDATATESGTETAAIPEVVPEGVAVPEGETPAATREPSARTERQPRQTERDPSLIDSVLGDPDETTTTRRQRPRDLAEEVLELPGAILGE